QPRRPRTTASRIKSAPQPQVATCGTRTRITLIRVAPYSTSEPIGASSKSVTTGATRRRPGESLPRAISCPRINLKGKKLMAKYLAHKTSRSSRKSGDPPRPDPVGPPNSGEALGRALSTAVILFHEAVASRLGLGAAEWRCLDLLDREGPATAGRLAELSGFTTGAITGIVDRLEKAGYVRREPTPRDRRSVIVRPLENRALREVVTPI